MAVRLRKLAPDEAQRAFPRRGQQDLSDYLAALGALQPGEAAAIEREGLSDRAIKRRLGAAAKHLGYRLKWARQHSPEALYFQVIGASTARLANGRRWRGAGRRGPRQRQRRRLSRPHHPPGAALGGLVAASVFTGIKQPLYRPALRAWAEPVAWSGRRWRTGACVPGPGSPQPAPTAPGGSR